MNKSFSLNKELKNLDNKELLSLMKDLIKFRKENKEFLILKLKGENSIEETPQYYKEKIDLAFEFEKFSMKKSRQALNDFKKISKDEKSIIELQVYYIECATNFEHNVGSLWEGFYSTVENMFKNVIKLLNKNSSLIPKYENRLNKIINKSCDGYGHRDILEEMIEDLQV